MSKNKKSKKAMKVVASANKVGVVIDFLPDELENLQKDLRSKDIASAIRENLGLPKVPADPKSVKVHGLRISDIEEIIGGTSIRPTKTLAAGILGFYYRLHPEAVKEAATHVLGFPVSALEFKYDGNGNVIETEVEK